MNLEAEADAAGRDDAAGNQGASDRGEPGGLQQKKKAAPPETPCRATGSHWRCSSCAGR